jgi:hypothetical protein
MSVYGKPRNNRTKWRETQHQFQSKVAHTLEQFKSATFQGPSARCSKCGRTEKNLIHERGND